EAAGRPQPATGRSQGDLARADAGAREAARGAVADGRGDGGRAPAVRGRGGGGRMTGSCRLLALAALLVAGAPLRVSAQCPDGSLPPCRVARPALDTARYLILPFAHREGSQSSLLDGADCAEYLSESFGRWSDVRLADSLLAADPGAFSGAGAEQTHSIAALRAYTQGARAIRNWDLAGATQHLRAALAADSDFARAYASLGQVLLWAADSTPEAMRD